MDEVGPRHRPAFCDAWERHGTPRGQIEVVCGPQRKVGVEFEVPDAVGAELEVADRHAVGGDALERL